MERRGLSQEGLKLIACAAMLIDHIGAVFVPGYGMRIIGRISFPIYCFLLAQGAEHTRNPRKYALRLALGALLAEIPYDLLFYGGIDPAHQSVMVTLLVGLVTLRVMKRWPGLAIPAAVAGFALAEAAKASYGGWGVALIVLLSLTARLPRRKLLLAVGMGLIFLGMGSVRLPGWGIPIQLFGLGALIPIGCYSGEKATAHPVIRWGFYLFYPLHLLALLMIRRLTGA